MKRAVIVTVVALAVLGTGFFATARLRAPSTEDEVKYRTSKVTFGTVKKTVSATGVLMPWTTVDIKSKAGGRVDALLVDEGSLVTKNQVLANIDPCQPSSPGRPRWS
jgi:multidrug efflux pump subunit AcrA (membrane-fusion protein)